MTDQLPDRLGVTRKGQIMAYVRALIESGAVAPGGRLPSEHDLAALFDTTRVTVRDAMSELAREGGVVLVPRVGAFVRVVEPLVWPMTVADARGDAVPPPWHDPGGAQFVVRTVRTPVRMLPGTRIVAGLPLADLLDLGPSGLVAVQGHLLFTTNPSGREEPREMTATYYDYDHVRGSAFVVDAELPERPDKLMTRLGAARAGTSDRLRARMPTVEERTALELPPGTPVMELVRVDTYRAEGHRRRLVCRHTLFAGYGNWASYQLP